MAFFPVVDVVGVGLNATDTLIHLKQFPVRGSKMTYSRELLQAGGEVASAMMACQHWGLQTRYVGKFGEDEAAALHEREFAGVGVEAHMVRVPGAMSEKSLILVDADGERTVLGRRDPRLVLKAEDLRREWVIQAKALLVDGFHTQAARQAACWAQEAGIPVVADVDEMYPGVEDVLALVDYLVVSRDVPGRLTGEAELGAALAALQRRFGCRLAAATLGTDGVLAWDGVQRHHACAFQVPVLDTTGAGDVFHAGFIYGLLQGWSLPAQLEFACAAAALNCTAQGARGGIRSLHEIEALRRNGARYRHSLEASQ